MRVLIGCESSGAVRRAFRARGHDAWSCDLLPSDDGSLHHLRGDVREFFDMWPCDPWDLLIAHPPCTHLAVSGARHFAEKRLDGRQQEAITFFLQMAAAPIPRIAIENPVCIMSTAWREPDQVIHPYQFGHPEFKATCLWLKGLPKLRPTDLLTPPERDSEDWKAWNRIHRMPPSADRWKKRSETFAGIADAMAEQWAGYSDLVTQMEAA